MSRLPLWVAALWWGSLSTIGFLVVPMLFAQLPTPALAGNMAARLFTAQTWVSTVCGLFLLINTRSNRSLSTVPAGQAAMIFIVSGLLLALLSEFAVAPRIVARENLRLWHSVGSAMYLAQWLCAGVTLWKLTERS
jgi:uncharacterized membrane protein